MATEIELLKANIPRLEKKFGANNPFVELLKAQLAFLQNKTEPQPQSEQHHPGAVNFQSSQFRKSSKVSNKQW